MATIMYPTSVAPTSDPGAFQIGGVNFAGTVRKLSLSRGSGVVTEIDLTAGGAATGVEIGPWGQDSSTFTNGLIFISEPLDAVTISGSITSNIRAAETLMANNYGVGFRVYRKTAGSTGNLTQIGSANDTTELGTAEAARTGATITPSSGTLSAGDRLVVQLTWWAAGGTSAGGSSVSGFYAGTASLASGDTFVTFTETITEQTAATAQPDRNTQMIQLLAH